ncbi:hypothetical protein [Lichenicoccus sp.]|uniref:hypothetical protein n=1 Tax=Lichenicoccus sp. TaxID=2781899 RepID=UPI003D0E73BD
MQHATDVVTGLILTLFDLIVAGIAAIEGALRHVLIQIGIGHEGQTLVLLACVAADRRRHPYIRRNLRHPDLRGAGAADAGRAVPGARHARLNRPLRSVP